MKRPPLPQPSPPEEERETLKEFLGLMPLFFESSILLTSAATIILLNCRQVAQRGDFVLSDNPCPSARRNPLGLSLLPEK